MHLEDKLFGKVGKIPCYAALWWLRPVDWCAEIQRRSRFRQETGDEQFFLYFEEGDEPVFHILDSEGRPKLAESDFRRYSLPHQSSRIHFWANQPVQELIIQYADENDMPANQASLRFGEIRLRAKAENQTKWSYNPILGVFNPLS